MVPVLFFAFVVLTFFPGLPADEVKIPSGRRRISFIQLSGNCPGAFLVDVSLKSLDECKKHCGVMSKCVGFSYSSSRDICFLKREGCAEPIIGSEFTYFQKFDATDIPKLLAESSAIDDPASLLAQAASLFLRQPIVSESRSIYRVEQQSRNQRKNNSANINNINNRWRLVNNDFGRSQETAGTFVDMFNRQALSPTTIPIPDCTKNAGSNSEYVLMFMFNMPDQPQTVDLEIYVSSDPSPNNVATDVEITMPHYPAYRGDKGSVAPGQTALFKLPQTVRMTQTGIDSKAIHVSIKNPSAKIQVYAVNRETYTSDGFLVFPTGQLGLEHYVLTWQPSTRGSEFGIAAPYDDTNIQIILPATAPPGSDPPSVVYNGKAYSNGDTLHLTMKADDTFLGINENLNSDLTGTRIISNRPIAVFSGDKRTAIKYISGDPPTRDHLVEQLPAVHTWGTEFVFCTSPNRTDGDFMKIVASQDSTQVLVYGGVSGAQQRQIATASTFVLIETAPQECLYISTTKPVMIGKFVVSQKPDQDVEKTDPAAVVIPPTSAYRSAYSFLTPAYSGLTPGETYTHFILIGVKKENKDGFIVDGRPVPLQQIVPTYNDYICGYLVVPSGQHTIQHSKADAKFLSILYGAADRESYAFVLGETLPTMCALPTDIPPGPDDKGNCTQPGTLLGSCPYCQKAQVAQGCYGTNLMLSCPADHVVKVISAHFGWFPGICGGSSCGLIQQGNCGMYNVYDNIARFCNGQSNCHFPVSTNALFTNLVFANYFCPLCSTRVQVYYTCILPSALSCASLVGRTPLFVRYTASSFWRREPGRSDVTCPDDISALTPIDAVAIPGYLPEFARYAAPHGLLWCPSECDTNSSYIQIDLGRVTRISGYAIQGRIGWAQWVSGVSVDYSSDGRSWMSLSSLPTVPAQPSLGMTGSGANNAIFDANHDADNVVVCDLSAFAIDARYLRAWIRSYQGYPCMRFDVFSCGDNSPQSDNHSFPIIIPTQSEIAPSSLPLTTSTTTAGTPPDNRNITSTTLPGPETTLGPTTENIVQPSFLMMKNRHPQTGMVMTAEDYDYPDSGNDLPDEISAILRRAKALIWAGDSDGFTTIRRRIAKRSLSPTPPSTSLDQNQSPIPPGCPPLKVVNSDISNGNTQRGVIGQRVTVHCLPAWMLPDFSLEFTVICDTTGSWVGIDSQCTETRNCGPIPDIDHGRYVTKGDPLKVGSSVTYSCDFGYHLIGNPTITCQLSTLWTAIPHCDKN